MAKLKLTKSELKNQRDALKRFARYLPTLQLKKQQLQLEVRHARDLLARLEADEREFIKGLQEWADIVEETRPGELREWVAVDMLTVATRNVAGIDTPVFHGLKFSVKEYDLFTTPIWFDDAVDSIQRLTELRIRGRLIQEQVDLLEQELRTTTQRVNLFEKVKIPEAADNIRRIQIYLGDQQANAVGRAKIAKGKTRSRELAAADGRSEP